MVSLMMQWPEQVNSSAQDDRTLLTALCQRQPTALAILYDRYSHLVYKLALQMLKTEDAAADLTQEVFLAVWQKPERYNPERGTMTVFLSVMTRSRALNRIRSAKSQQSMVERFSRIATLESGDSPTLAQASLTELSDRVRQALQALPEAQRTVLEMAYYEGLSQSDITKRTGIPLGTVKSRSRQGLLKLRELLHDLAE
ncbi:sigma-70 family RNA polymerase sigma factor [Alkalinema pantanalense CENA528]|uniref:sigma-70 family RNA polymerase sigma factor n=1 Tax=Alkalinema pantanalense TaxID=1620705 RepID=UPI003D6F9865